jgi:arylsulfatase A-like enzyme
VGRWKRNGAADAKFSTCAIRDSRWKIIRPSQQSPAWQLYDLQNDPAEAHDLASQHPDTVARLAADYEQWWDSIQPSLVNESAPVTGENTFHTLYRAQFGGP